MSDSAGVPRSLRLRGALSEMQMKTELVTRKACENPTWTRKQLVEWAAREFEVKESTAKGYIYRAAKFLNRPGGQLEPSVPHEP